MAPTRLQVFTRFSTDAVGLERLLRLLQAVLLLTLTAFLPAIAYLSPLSLPSFFLFHSSPADYFIPVDADAAAQIAKQAAAAAHILEQLVSRVALARRWLRLFRFLESFSAAQAIVSGRAGGGRRSGGLPAELLLDALSRTLNGLYLLLETLTLPSVLGIHGLPSFLPGDEPWAGKYGTSRMLAKEAQRFWFLSLVCAFAAAGVRAFKTLVYAAVPETGEGYGTGEKAALAPQQKEDHHHQHDQHHGASLTKHEANDVSTEPAVGDLSALQQERARLRLIVEARKAERISRRRAVGAAVALQTRTMAITSLDMLTPGTAIGWLWAPRPIVALAMLTSTWQTAKDVWRRCEKEIVLGR